jgi:hypothetical protein
MLVYGAAQIEEMATQLAEDWETQLPGKQHVSLLTIALSRGFDL